MTKTSKGVYTRYNHAALDEPLSAVHSGHLNQCAASKRFKIPHATLRNKITGRCENG